MKEVKDQQDKAQLKKSNVVIHSLYSMSLYANRIFTYLIHTINDLGLSDSGSDVSFFLSLSELQKYGLVATGGKICTIEYLRSLAEEIQSVRFYCEEQGVGFVSIIAVPTIAYDETRSGFAVKINNDALPFISNMSHGYTLLNSGEVSQLDSAYAYRLYEIIKSEIFERKNGYIPSMVITVEKLKFLLGMCKVTSKSGKYLSTHVDDFAGAYLIAIQDPCNQNTCESWRVFKRTLDRCVEKINKVTDMHLSYRAIREGRGGKITALEFQVESPEKGLEPVIGSGLDGRKVLKDAMKATEASSAETDAMELASQMDGITPKKALQLLEFAKGDKELVLKQYRNYQAHGTSVKNPFGWIKCAIEGNWEWDQSEWKNADPSVPANFEQRKYDMVELEKELLR